MEEISSRLAIADGSSDAAALCAQVVEPPATADESHSALPAVENSALDNPDDSGPDSYNNESVAMRAQLDSLSATDPAQATSSSSCEPFVMTSTRLQSHSRQPRPTQTTTKDLVDHDSATLSQYLEPTVLIKRYRTYMQSNFPFVVVPEALSRADARRQRPLLWRAIEVAALWRDEAKCAELGDRLLEDIMSAAVKRACKTIDLIRGLLVFIAW